MLPWPPNNPTLSQFNSNTKAAISPHGYCNRGDCALFFSVSPHMKHGQAYQPTQINRMADSSEPILKASNNIRNQSVHCKHPFTLLQLWPYLSKLWALMAFMYKEGLLVTLQVGSPSFSLPNKELATVILQKVLLVYSTWLSILVLVTLHISYCTEITEFLCGAQEPKAWAT